jgi:hypothetical protein
MVVKKTTMVAAASALIAISANFQSSFAATPTTSNLLPVSSPTWLPSVGPISDLPTAVPTGAIPTGALPSTVANFNAFVYPEGWKTPPTDSAEVQAVMKALDWSKVPNATVNKANANGDLDMSGYDTNTDPYCWWTDTNCVNPKVDFLPQDIYYCPRDGMCQRTCIAA